MASNIPSVEYLTKNEIIGLIYQQKVAWYDDTGTIIQIVALLFIALGFLLVWKLIKKEKILTTGQLHQDKEDLLRQISSFKADALEQVGVSKKETLEQLSAFKKETLEQVGVSKDETLEQILNNRVLEKQSKAIDIILEAEQTKVHDDGMSIIAKYEPPSVSIIDLALKGIKAEERKDRYKLVSLLNYYEYLAVAIKNNIVCESIMKECNFSTLKKIHDECMPFILEIRKRFKIDHYFIEFESMAVRWIDCGHNGELPDQATHC
jgi:hypothetical protein